MTRIIPAGIVIMLLAGCAAGERPELLRPRVVRTERDVYVSSYRSDPAALRAWQSAGRRALRSGLEVAPGFRERVRFPSADPHAVAYRFALVRGQVVEVRIDRVAGAGTLFPDVFHHVGGEIFRPVHTRSASASGLAFAATADGEYVLRIQPPVGAGGTIDVVVNGGVSLAFPVAGGGMRDVGSSFGDPRDGGARSHEGVDIFAPRGTPVLAAADGFIRQARNTPTGGLVIWQADASSELTYYYAHLDELHAREGTYVRAGETIGTVGNTGNARGVAPHLHFAVYRPGTIPLDPAPLLAARTVRHDNVRAIDGRLLGSFVIVSGDGVRLRSSPSFAGPVIRELAPDSRVLVLGDSGDWQRVVLADGTTGFIAIHLATAEADM